MKVLVVTAMYPTNENPAFGSFIRTQVESLRQIGVHVELLVLNGRYRKLIYPKGMFQLRNVLQDDSIDIVHAHYGLVGIVARTQWKVPVVVTFHGDDLLGTINPQGKTKWVSKPIAAAGSALGRIVDAVIVQSRQMAAKVKHVNVYIIPHEINLGIFQPTDRNAARAALGLENKKKYLLFAANPAIPVKRFPLAKAVAEHLQKENPSVELLVICKEKQERLALYMNACDALVFPSFQEGSPNIVKQAMACNLPIVATDVGDVREMISPASRCFVSSPTVTEFAGRLRQILANCERSDGRDHIRHLDGPSVARRVLRVYEDTLRTNLLGQTMKLPS